MAENQEREANRTVERIERSDGAELRYSDLKSGRAKKQYKAWARDNNISDAELRNPTNVNRWYTNVEVASGRIESNMETSWPMITNKDRIKYRTAIRNNETRYGALSVASTVYADKHNPTPLVRGTFAGHRVLGVRKQTKADLFAVLTSLVQERYLAIVHLSALVSNVSRYVAHGSSKWANFDTITLEGDLSNAMIAAFRHGRSAYVPRVVDLPNNVKGTVFPISLLIRWLVREKTKQPRNNVLDRFRQISMACYLAFGGAPGGALSIRPLAAFAVRRVQGNQEEYCRSMRNGNLVWVAGDNVLVNLRVIGVEIAEDCALGLPQSLGNFTGDFYSLADMAGQWTFASRNAIEYSRRLIDKDAAKDRFNLKVGRVMQWITEHGMSKQVALTSLIQRFCGALSIAASYEGNRFEAEDDLDESDIEDDERADEEADEESA